jgi:phospholipase C
MRLSPRWVLAVLPFPSLLPVACGSSSGSPGQDSGVHDTGSPEAGRKESGPPAEAGGKDAGKHDSGGTEAGTCPAPDGGKPPVAPTASNIKHVVVVVQENHTFDNYFSYYCTAATGSKPTCNTGPACCETGPAMDAASGNAPVTQNDAQNGTYDPDHNQSCELTEIDDGKMDDYVTSKSCGYSLAQMAGNYAYANETTAKPYWDLATSNALADNYFQSVAGASSSNDMYLATASYVFLDDEYEPAAIGAACEFTTQKSFTNMTIGDLLVTANVPWGWFGQGYDAMVAAQKEGNCPTDPMCPMTGLTLYPCVYDPGDDPFAYFKQFADNPKYVGDYTQFICNLSSDSLPGVTYLKAIGYRSEHPGFGDTISAGEAFVTEVADAVAASPYKSDTLVLVTWDESGGFYDHVSPPAESTIDDQPYGPRIPMLAIGSFAKQNYISHVQMEHSSIVKFIEWNWLSQMTGQLGQRDTVVNNIGDMLDPTMTGTTVPAD